MKLFLRIIFLLAFYNSFSQIINERSVQQHIYTLANDSMQGRKAGEEGIENRLFAYFFPLEKEKLSFDQLGVCF